MLVPMASPTTLASAAARLATLLMGGGGPVADADPAATRFEFATDVHSQRNVSRHLILNLTTDHSWTWTTTTPTPLSPP